MATVAERYDKSTTAYQGKDGLYLIDRITPEKGNHVLDLGCGTGYLASVLAERVGPEGKVVGVDPDIERVLYAHKKYGNVIHLQFLKGDCESFPAGPYDIVFCNHVMHWVEHMEIAFENVYRSLKRGGVFALVGVEEISPIVVKMQKADVEDSIFKWSSDDFENVACKCGFEVDFKSIEPRKYTFPNVEAFINWSQASTNLDSDSASFAEHVKKLLDGVVEIDITLVVLVLMKNGT